MEIDRSKKLIEHEPSVNEHLKTKLNEAINEKQVEINNHEQVACILFQKFFFAIT
jgi:hypothetical protein